MQAIVDDDIELLAQLMQLLQVFRIRLIALDDPRPGARGAGEVLDVEAVDPCAGQIFCPHGQ